MDGVLVAIAFAFGLIVAMFLLLVAGLTDRTRVVLGICGVIAELSFIAYRFSNGDMAGVIANVLVAFVFAYIAASAYQRFRATRI